MLFESMGMQKLKSGLQETLQDKQSSFLTNKGKNDGWGASIPT